MDSHIKDFFSQYSAKDSKGNFHCVIPLHETNQSWDEICKMCPALCKGWFELAHLVSTDRIDFIHDFWLSKLPYHPKLKDFLDVFFSGLDDIGIFLIQKKFEDSFEPHLVYSLNQDRGFFHGSLPATDQQIIGIKKFFPNELLPLDYMAFLQIHNGFRKATDCTGILSSDEMERSYQNFQVETSSGPILTNSGSPVDPKKLIPFYESFGMPFFQCFWTEWYPDYEMGNVYYSGLSKTISDTNKGDPYTSMAFPTFTDWLMFYLDKID